MFCYINHEINVENNTAAPRCLGLIFAAVPYSPSQGSSLRVRGTLGDAGLDELNFLSKLIIKTQQEARSTYECTDIVNLPSRLSFLTTTKNLCIQLTVTS